MIDQEDVFRIEVALRDARHMGVIMALDRLVVFPETEGEIKAALNDMKIVRDFIYQSLPERLRPTARTIFVEHGKAIEAHIRSAREKGR